MNGIGPKNLSSKTVTLKRGTIVAHISAGKISSIQAGAQDNHKSILCKCAPKWTPGCGG